MQAQPTQKYAKLEEQYREAYIAYKQNPNQETAARLLEVMDPILERHVHSLPGANKAVLKNKAKLIVLKSIDRYNPEETSMNTFMSQQLMGLRRENRSQDPRNIIKTPEHRELAFNRIREAKVELANQLDREPTNEELADYLKMPVEHVAKYQNKTTAVNEGRAITQTEGEDGANSNNPSVKTTMSTKARTDYVYGELNDQDRLIFTHSPEYAEQYGNEAWDAGTMSKNLNRSESFISNRKKEIQRKLEEADNVF